MLRDFIDANRDEILAQARSRVVARSGEPTSGEGRAGGLPVFLDQLCEALRKVSAREELDHSELQESAGQHGHVLFHDGLSVDQVVHDYGDLCQVITSMVSAKDTSIDIVEFRTLNLCLDDAIAGAVTAYSAERDRSISDEGTERLGVLAHEMRNALNTAILAFGSIKQGVVATSGSTGAMLDKSHLRLQRLIDRSLADVRLDAGLHNIQKVPVREILEEVAVGETLVADTRGLKLSVVMPDRTVFIEADRQIVAAAVANLLQNALKFTRPGTTVQLRATTTATRVLIDIEDQCGGLPPGKAEDLFRPFQQRGADRSGLGLGLSIGVKAARASSGELRVRDMPGHGCVFTLDLPRKPPPPLTVVDGLEDTARSTAGSPDTAKVS